MVNEGVVKRSEADEGEDVADPITAMNAIAYAASKRRWFILLVALGSENRSMISAAGD